MVHAPRLHGLDLLILEAMKPREDNLIYWDSAIGHSKAESALNTVSDQALNGAYFQVQVVTAVQVTSCPTNSRDILNFQSDTVYSGLHTRQVRVILVHE